MTTREWCDNCGVPTEFDPHPTAAYTIVCSWCGHNRIERTRSSRPREEDTQVGHRFPPAPESTAEIPQSETDHFSENSGRSLSRRRESDSGPSPRRLKNGHGGDFR